MLLSPAMTSTIDSPTLKARFEQELQLHKGKYVSQGTVFIILGILAAALPATFAVSAELLIGIALLVSGLFQLALSIKSQMHWWSALSSVLSIAIGILMIAKPLVGLFAIMTLIAAFMTIEGLFEVLLAFQFRAARNWGWMLFTGIITLILAAVLWLGFPTLDVLYLGWMIAVNFILYGLSLLMLVWKVKSEKTV